MAWPHMATATGHAASTGSMDLVPTPRHLYRCLKWVCLKMVSTPTPNGFADHYPVFKWLFHWEYTLFSDKPK